MTQEPQSSSPVNRLRVPPISLSEASRRAGLAALIAAVGGAVLYAVALPLISIVTGAAVEYQTLLPNAVVAGMVVGCVVFVVRLLALSRSVLARSFAAATFAATFFGLFVLVILLYNIGHDALTWFQIMPALVEERNEALQAQAQQAKSHQSQADVILKEIAELEKESLAQAPPSEHEKIKKLWDRRRTRALNDLKTTSEELQQIENQLRPNTSPSALLGHFLTSFPSHHVQDAGIWPALLGSLYVGIITLVFAVPLGVGAAVYLEEYRRSTWLARIIQTNIGNLAGVPSIVYGILGSFVFVELFFRNLQGALFTPAFLSWFLGAETADRFMHAVFGDSIAARNVLGGGLTLAMLTLPLMIVSAQEAIRAVPVSLRHGALALGATRWQVVWHQVLPSARPGILTGMILSLSRALGEAAPLVMFGALIFVTRSPTLFGNFIVLPMQIFAWFDLPGQEVSGQSQEVWRYNAAMASIVLLLTLLALNATAIFLRYRAQRAML